MFGAIIKVDDNRHFHILLWLWHIVSGANVNSLTKVAYNNKSKYKQV